MDRPTVRLRPFASIDDDVALGLDWQQNDRPGPGAWESARALSPRDARSRRRDRRSLPARRVSVRKTTARRIWAGTEVENIAEHAPWKDPASFKRAGSVAAISATADA
jgi:hypothetical protein